jgi:stage V sporulation protein G
MPERRKLDRIIKIERMNVTREGNCKAFLSLIVADTFIVRNVKVIEGPNGLFVCMPKEKYKTKSGEEKTMERAFPASLSIRKQLTELVLNEYRKRHAEVSSAA